MNAGELHRLARMLRELATQATAEAGEATPSPGLIAVVEDITRYPGSTITDIVNRTRLAQSFVSKTVAELREAGFVVTQPDAQDRRRVRVSLAAGVRQEVLLPRAMRPLATALAQLYPELSAPQVTHAEALLDELLALLTQ